MDITFTKGLGSSSIIGLYSIISKQRPGSCGAAFVSADVQDHTACFAELKLKYRGVQIEGCNKRFCFCATQALVYTYSYIYICV